MSDLPTETVEISEVEPYDFLIYDGEALAVTSVTIRDSGQAGHVVQVMMVDKAGVEWVTNAYPFRERTILRRDYATLLRGFMWLNEDQ